MTTDVEGLSWVRVTFVDVFGVGNAVQLPAERFAAAVERGEPFDGSALEGRARHLESDMLLRPDPSTLVRLGGGLARAVGNVLTLDGAPWPGDSRTALSAVITDIADLAATVTMAAELEFYLVDAKGQPVDRGGYYDDVEGLGIRCVRAAAERLVEYGVPIDACHHEAGPGQYELDVAPRPPLALADGLVLAKHVVREVATDVGVRATFMPRPFGGEAGSGLHIHQRFGGGLVNEDGKLDEDGRAYVAGQLVHAGGLCALAAPTVNSYKRLHSGPEAPSAAVWAHANRAALLRVSAYPDPGASIEFRGSDPSANPYLLAAGLLVAGGHGMEAGLELAPPLEEDVGGFDPAGESMRFDPLPRDLDGALDALTADEVLVDAFDSLLLNRLIDGRRLEAREFRSHVTGWELDRYLDEA